MAVSLALPSAAYANPLADLLGLESDAAPAAAFDEEKTVDPSTITTWEGIAGQNTQNIGRIWTDKTVSSTDVQLPASSAGVAPKVEIGDSDFLVTLSALSSTSNTSVTSSKPLDIVLVLDASGSMGDTIAAEYAYDQAYRISTNGRATYYAQVDDGSYVEIERITNWRGQFDHWELNGATVAPKTSADDTDSSHVQFYTRSTTVETSKMDALHNAANDFITSTAAQNDLIDDAAKQHRVSIVKFAGDKNDTVGNDIDEDDYNYSQIVTKLTAYTSSDVSTATDTVNSISAAGATSADYGMEHAQTVLNEARDDAQKVVIFFTDGQPNHNNGFNSTVANSAISTAGKLKSEKALVYTIGVFEDADPSNTETTSSNQFNAYMHAMSSNYPNATAWNSLGDRVSQDSAYYKAATNSDELDNIFKEISDEINSGAGLPTETQDGFENKSGYITFTDELGAYMQVDGFKDLVFADKVFKPVGNPTVEGNTTTYTYEGTGDTALYPNGNVSDIVIKVEKSDSLAQGDKVTVKIPGSLIPLRNFTVDDNGDTATMDITDAYPMRIFYGVSVKPGVADALKNGTADQDLKNYIADHTTDGKTSFYSNFYDGMLASGAQTLGNTTASFEPAPGNSFYYFTENTQLYTDEACTSKLMTEPTSGETYYYKRSYYDKDAATGVVTKKDAVTRFVGANFDADTTFWGQASDGSYYIKAGAPRLTRIDDLTLSKNPNATGTATEVIKPNWDNINNPNMINVSLGNNGKIDVELPGTLAISKDARVAPNKGLSAETLKDKEFTFKIDIPAAKGKTLKAEVKNEQGEVTAPLFDITFDSNGIATHSIKDNETLYIYGLDAGAEYTVDETSIPFGFNPTSKTNDTGTIVGNTVTNVAFENTYDVQPVTVPGADFATYLKSFDHWDVEDSFDIRLSEENHANPMPEGSAPGADGMDGKTVQVTEAANSGNFGDITFDSVGTYTYTIFEVTPSSMVAGMTYSKASYSAEVTVTDKGDGTLQASTKMLKLSDDNGNGMDPYEEVTSKQAVFNNSFNAESVDAGPVAAKVYTNNGGPENDLKDGMFRFKVKAVGDNAAEAPIPAGAQVDEQGYLYVTNNGPAVAFGQATFTKDHVGHTYTYEISEVLPAEATADNGYTVAGMTYDPSVYTASFAVSSENKNGVDTVKVDVTYSKNGQALTAGDVPQFVNSYDPADVVLAGDTALAASKTLNGRDSQANESFEFTLSARSNATIAALQSDEIVFGGDKDATEMKVAIDGLTNGEKKTASFGDIAFTKPGTFTFNVKETVPSADGAGMVYDRTTQTATVVVTDDNGVLKASVSYTGSGDSASFTNTYTSSMTYGTDMNLTVGKTLNGRAQKAGEFEFSIAGADSTTVTADEATAKLAESDKSFKTIADANSGLQSQMFNLLSGLRFTQADAGKTFSYVLSEKTGSLGGVTYDESTYQLDIVVIDDADGTMHTATTIQKTTDKGTERVGTYDGNDGLDRVVLGFTNTYKAAPVKVEATEDVQLHKVLTGRDWKASDSFEFTLVADDAANPSLERATCTVTQPEGTADGTDVPFDFGGATFDAPGQYHYTVTETNGGQTIDGVKYDPHTADVYVRVTDPGDGQLIAQAEVNSGTFTNTYEAELNHNDAGGIIVTKTTNGHDMAQGQFQFRVETLDGDGVTAAETAQRIDITNGTTGDFGNIAGKDGQKVEMPSENPITFTQADVGKTFKLKISERGADGASFGSGGTKDGYTYDDQVYTVELSVADNGDGTLKLTTKVTDKDGNESTQTSSAADKHATYLDFVNSYGSTVPADAPVTTDNLFAKVLDGRDWQTSDSFAFAIAPQDGAPAPEQGTVTLTGRTDTAGTQVNFGFGKINFTFNDVKDVEQAVDGTRTKNFVYKVKEVVPADTDKIAGITYDTREVTLTVTLTDDGKGNLAATSNVANGPFTNTYASGAVDVDVAGGVQIVKTMTGRAIAADDFEFTMKAVNDDAKAKFGADAKTVQTVAADLGTGESANTAVATTPVTTGLKFGLADAGKTFEFGISELGVDGKPGTGGSKDGYTYDGATHKVEFAVSDDGAGTLTVIAKLDGNQAAEWSNTVATRAAGDAVSVPFANSYDAGSITVGGDGEVALTGTKELTGRDMVAGEFHFDVTNAADDAKKIVATGTNTADGAINFTGITYTTEQLSKDVAAGLATVERGDAADVYTYGYTVSEAASQNDDGITVVQGNQAIKVKVSDNHAGKLSAEVVYPDGGMVFKNVYDAGAEATVSIDGAKVLDVESGDNAPDITGKYTFAIAGSEGAPMPEKTTATNDAAGNVSFGNVTYTMEGIFGASGATGDGASADEESAGESDEPATASAQRSKTFTYQVTESGTVDGVANDASVKTVKVTVTDNGDGTLSVSKSTAGEASDFTFVNTYSVDPVESSPTGQGALTVTKELDGRDLAAKEFSFELRSAATGDVVKATNDAQGAVSFPALTFTEPGDYAYKLAEIDAGAPGVTYDTTVHQVLAHVADNGDGTLSVTWSLASDGQPLDAKSVTFSNAYQAKAASLTFNASKKLDGRDIVEGEFSFELRDGNGNVLQTVQNGAAVNGVAPIAFAPVAYDAPGEFDYQIVEVKGDAEGVTYDETVFTYHVVVSDNGKGNLEASWTVGDAGAPVFENVYDAPEGPAVPGVDTGEASGSDAPATPKTSDALGFAAAALAVLGVLSATLALIGAKRSRASRR